MSEHIPSSCNYSSLPPEIWGLVLECLPRTDQRSCLSVSTAFRGLAHPLIFSRIIIHYGMWKARERDVGFSLQDLRLMEQRCTSNTELLQHVARDARFARSVRTISVRAHDAMKWCDADDIQHLINALESFPHLQSFQCDILDSDEDASRYFGQFRNLQTLCVAGDRRHLPIYTRSEYELIIRTCAQHTPNTLLRLSVWQDAVWDTPLRVLSGLQELSMYNPCSLDRLDVVFAQCRQLRSLNIMIASPSCVPQVLAVLEAAPSNTLPHLTSFKFVCTGDSGIIDSGPFSAFLGNRPAMRRLDLRFNECFRGVVHYTRFLDIFAGLAKLEVVGLTLAGSHFSQEHLKLLDARLPRGLSALLLTWAFIPVDDDVMVADWIVMLKRRPSLGYFHVLDYVDSLNLRDTLLQARLPALELVGYGAHMANIERSVHATDESVYGPHWKEETVNFGTAEDFGCEDWAWLLQYHDWDGLS
ncbi:uncharacterized protein TRAVEDRAFT_49872 [Trametes versicolor FP-101664 SS1]|uniref:uncharacterized protein n=1 Tax=Trametes versicolor (strain FP-101664) TaxID=717944 RepID=UPI0004622B12|nr:uncharacterized protein TRAVEDRAFT_49872 [Trametes versicolor FP-101664 SS1]EIW57061.1 hypothetical protein TRAVEDRAFT_49872 [Trametes versicolor FP-101664 SS1]